MLALVGGFLSDFADMVAQLGRLGGWGHDPWPDDPSEAQPNWDVMKEIAGRGYTPHSQRFGTTSGVTEPA